MPAAWKTAMSEPRFIFGEMTDPGTIAQIREQDEHAPRNDDWLKAHWPEIVPRARGRFLAVAGQEAFIADTPEEAWAMAMAAHPGGVSRRLPLPRT